VLHLVDLVEHQQVGSPGLFRRRQRHAVFIGGVRRVDQDHDQVHTRQRLGRHPVQMPIQCMIAPPVESRRIDQHDLSARMVDHAGDAVPGGLGLVGHDRDVLADQLVDQRRLSGIRTADQRHGARSGALIVRIHSLGSLPRRSSTLRAAACSAFRRELAVARTGWSSNSTSQATVNSRWCSAPRSSTTSYSGKGSP
jgi:hypothetical protein